MVWSSNTISNVSFSTPRWTFALFSQIPICAPFIHFCISHGALACVFVSDTGQPAWSRLLLWHGGLSGGSGYWGLGTEAPEQEGLWPWLCRAVKHLWGQQACHSANVIYSDLMETPVIVSVTWHVPCLAPDVSPPRGRWRWNTVASERQEGAPAGEHGWHQRAARLGETTQPQAFSPKQQRSRPGAGVAMRRSRSWKQPPAIWRPACWRHQRKVRSTVGEGRKCKTFYFDLNFRGLLRNHSAIVVQNVMQ